jgi:hypothetical protein
MEAFMDSVSTIRIQSGNSWNGEQIQPEWLDSDGHKVDTLPDESAPRPAGEQIQNINRQLQEVLEAAPSDASAELVVQKDTDGYRSLLKIHSLQRRFVTGAHGHLFTEVIEHVLAQVRRQITQWSQERLVLTGDES